jgi:ribonuclease PH
MLRHCGPIGRGLKMFVAQIPPTSKFPPMQRSDGRGPDEIRPLNFELNVAPHASGSVLVSMGKTRVICAVTIDEAVPRWMKEQGVTGGWLTAEYSMLPYSTQPRKPRDTAKGRIDGRSVEIQRLIGRSLRAVMDLEKLGPRTIWIDCDVLQADGGTRTTAITGASLALAIACRKLVREKKLDTPPMQKLAAAVSAGILDGRTSSLLLILTLWLPKTANLWKYRAPVKRRRLPDHSWMKCWLSGAKVSPSQLRRSARCSRD